MENESDATASSRLPHSISEYTFLEFLGEGATAQVYLAEHEASGAHVAIKVIDKLLIQRAQLENKVRQEMVLHAELKHPHVLLVESVFEDARNYYMVLEYCAQRSLSVVVKTLPNRKLDEQIVKTIFRQVLAGVTYLHASGVIHRDLKLANLLLSDTGTIKISDFGLAARLGDDHVTMCGTPNFIAPEVLMAENAPYDEAVDVWSLGCILYCLLLGKPPFEGRKVGETLENVANAGQNPLQFPEGFSSSASDLIKRLLTSDPRRRPSAQQIMLHPWLREQSRTRVLSSSSAKRQLSNGLRSVPSHPHATSRSSRNVRDTYQASKARLTNLEELEKSSSSSSVLALARRRNFRERKQRGHREAPAKKMKNVKRLSKAAASSSDSCSLDNDTLNDEDYSDLSELSPSTLFDFNELKRENDTMSQTDAISQFQHSSTHARSVVSVVLHLELQSVSCFGLCDQQEDDASGTKMKLQWSCKEPAEIGRPPMFELEVSNGWQVCYDPAIGLLTATTLKGEVLRYNISGVGKAQVNSSVDPTPTAHTTYQTRLPLLVRFCQCLALRSMQLRQMALRDQTRKLPLNHFDTLPESLLTSFQYRSSLLKSSITSLMNKDISGISDSNSGRCQYVKGLTERVEIASVGYGCIDETGDLKVTFLDGAQLTLAANGLQLRFRPSWANDSAPEDVYELLTGSSMSAFLPSAVKQKLTNIPEFIRRLKATA